MLLHKTDGTVIKLFYKNINILSWAYFTEHLAQWRTRLRPQQLLSLSVGQSLSSMLKLTVSHLNPSPVPERSQGSEVRVEDLQENITRTNKRREGDTGTLGHVSNTTFTFKCRT